MNVINELKSNIKKIERLGWIKYDNSLSGGVGLKIEELLGLKKNNFEYPDYNGIEIKSKKVYSRQFLTLFNATPDNNLYEIKRIQRDYGYLDKFKINKVFNLSIYSQKSINSDKHHFRLHVDYDNEVVRMIVLNKYNEIVDKNISWSFKMLEDKFVRKFNIFCIIYYRLKRVSNEYMFNIKSFSFYERKSFENFLTLIEKDKIIISFKIGVFKSGSRIGQVHDRGTSFDINLEAIDSLFNEL